MAPEQYLDEEFDLRPIDVWAIGMIYMAMRTGKLLWGAALKNKDSNYIRYLSDRTLDSGFRPIERLENVSLECLLNRSFMTTLTVVDL